MTEKSLIKKYLEGKTAGPDSPEVEEVEDFGCFGWLRGIHDRALMVELRKTTGDIEAVSYGLLERATFDPSNGITLYAANRKYRVTGRNLGTIGESPIGLFNGLVRHRVPWIQEAPKGAVLLDNDDKAVVEAIEW